MNQKKPTEDTIQQEAEVDNLTGFFNVLLKIDRRLAKERKTDDN